MTPSVLPVLVVGAGPSGLISALALLQNNIPVRIIDKELNHRTGQRGAAQWPRTFEAYRFLHVHEVHQRATPVHPMREYKPGTLEPARTFPLVPHRDPTPSTPYSNPMVLGQPLLEGILRSHLAEYGCLVELGTELQSFEDDGERVLARLMKKKGGEEIPETFEASYLIGAEGARGVTRKQLGFSFLGETRQDFCCVIGDICLKVDEAVIDRKHWHLIRDGSSTLLSLRPTDEIAHDGFQLVMTLEKYDPKQLIADEKLMFKCMSELLGHEVNVREIVFLSEFQPNIRMADRFGKGRVFIVGDAAHVHSPTGGQGLNSCVQDAVNLAWKLSLVYKGLSPASLLDSYTTERLPVIAEMLNITTGLLNRILTVRTANGAFGRGDRLDMLGVNCRASHIVVDEFTRAEPVDAYGVLDETVLVAGDRAPDAPGLIMAGSTPDTRIETALFDVFNLTYHVVLVFTTDVAAASDVLEALKKYPKDVVRALIILPQGSGAATIVQADVVVDRDGHAYRGYLAVNGEQKVVVVRPDGVVGAVVRGVEGLGQYFSKIFI